MRYSFIFGTYNRREHLERCLQSIDAAVAASELGPEDYEIVVGDGGSTDGSLEVLKAHPRVRIIPAGLDGAVRAFNLCFDAARGDCVVTLNDDLHIAYPRFLAEMPALFAGAAGGPRPVGQVALAYKPSPGRAPIVNPIYPKLHYANFGVIDRALAVRIRDICGGFWAPCYRTYGGDTELSCWVHRLGYDVLPYRYTIDDLCLFDELRRENYKDDRGKKDNRTFWTRWSSREMLNPKGPLPRVDEGTLRRLQAAEA